VLTPIFIYIVIDKQSGRSVLQGSPLVLQGSPPVQKGSPPLKKVIKPIQSGSCALRAVSFGLDPEKYFDKVESQGEQKAAKANEEAFKIVGLAQDLQKDPSLRQLYLRDDNASELFSAVAHKSKRPIVLWTGGRKEDSQSWHRMGYYFDQHGKYAFDMSIIPRNAIHVYSGNDHFDAVDFV
jgi:hypothetical protein